MSKSESESPTRWLIGELKHDWANHLCPNNRDVLRSFFLCLEGSIKRQQNQAKTSCIVADSIITERCKMDLQTKPKRSVVRQINRLVEEYRSLLKSRSSLHVPVVRKRAKFMSELNNSFDVTPKRIKRGQCWFNAHENSSEILVDQNVSLIVNFLCLTNDGER